MTERLSDCSFFVMLCYIMLCYVMLCYVVLCRIMYRHVSYSLIAWILINKAGFRQLLSDLVRRWILAIQILICFVLFLLYAVHSLFVQCENRVRKINKLLSSPCLLIDFALSFDLDGDSIFFSGLLLCRVCRTHLSLLFIHLRLSRK